MHDVLLLGNVLLLPTPIVEKTVEVVTGVSVDSCNVVMIDLDALLVDPIVTVAVEPDDVTAPLDVL